MKRSPLRRGTKRLKRSRFVWRPKKPDPRVFGPQAERCRQSPCCVCGRPPRNEPHHTPTVAAGGLDHDTSPVCWVCHSELGTVGIQTFETRHNVDLRAVARRMRAA